METHRFIPADSVKIPQIRSMGFSNDPRITQYGPFNRNEYIIHYVLSGKGFFHGNTVEKGEGFLITPGMYQAYRPDQTDPWGFLWFTSTDHAMKYFFERYRANSKTGIFKIHDLHEINAVVQELRSSSNSISSSAKISELFLRSFHAAVSPEAIHQRAATKIYFDFAINYIKTNLHLPISVDDLCSMIGISQPYLYRIFKQETTLSPKQYISDCRIKQAKDLLTQTDFSISQIAASVGFQSVLDFSKFFSKRTLLSPTAYRNRYR